MPFLIIKSIMSDKNVSGITVMWIDEHFAGGNERRSLKPL